MTFYLEISEVAERRLKKFDKELQRRFFKKVEKLKINPYHGKPLRYNLSGTWELYFEKSFRILYSIDKNSKKITIESIWHKDEF